MSASMAGQLVLSSVYAHALLEGMRQTDERSRLLAGLPALTQSLALVPDSQELIDPHPVTKEILTFTAPLPDHMARTWKALDWKENDVPADPFTVFR